MIRHRDYVEVSAAPDRATFESRLIRIANDLDFGIVSAALVVEEHGFAPRFICVGNTPQGFAEAAKNMESSKRDPVLERMKRLSTPFFYDQALYVREGAGDLWEEQAPYGYHTGIAMALHLPGNLHFLLGVDRDKPLPTDDRDLTQLMAYLQLLAVHAQDSAVRLLLDEGRGHIGAPHLTDREKEVLRWTMQGKSRTSIAEILGISLDTVKFHLRNVMAKLQTESKHQAVLKAISLGLI